jgi:predicted AAA+ superfamily ATPase
VRRLSGHGGDPVVQLQTNFGGGKTHSMLALYHLFSGIAPTELIGIDTVLQEAEAKKLPTAKRVVLVGNKISPGNPSTKPDGTIVRTLWGELAWQLGGKKAFARIKADDEKATSPGDVLRELFTDYGPCLILIDEWVAYARQLHDQSDLPAGGFETQFTFAQVLTESAKLAKSCLLVISLPASDTAASPHTQADDVEVGGRRGREALDRLRNVVGRVEASWRPASAEEGFEIVRRRLFEPMADPAQFKDRDVVARAFADLYRTQHQEFPPECRDADYEKRLKAAYPIHPEIFDRLYTDWSTLVKFQRTRGVLRLMAAVIHSLWEKGDRNPLILPANISVDDPRVQFEANLASSDLYLAAYAAFDFVKSFALTTKHRGFSEEREWRAIYVPERDPLGYLKGHLDYSVGPRGVEPKLKFKFGDRSLPRDGQPGEPVTTQKLSDILEFIMLGPSASSPLAQKAFIRMLQRNNKTDFGDRVIAAKVDSRRNVP